MLSYIDLYTDDAEFNLAAEQYIFDELPRDRSWFMLWQNRKAVIIGKYQNTLAEIDESFIRENGIQVVRRLSGGGAVYHDLGNLNFTFITDAGNAEKLNMKLFCEPVVRALASLGVNAEINGRNDMTIDGRKFSGNAQYMRDGRIMHHGTIMFDSDLETVSSALRVDPEKIQSKGTKSVRSRVTNVRPHLAEDCSLDDFRRVLLENIISSDASERYEFSDEDLRRIEDIKMSRYSLWEWNYGRSREAALIKKKRIEGCGAVEARISTDRGLICELSFTGDFFSTEEPSVLAERFIGIRPEKDEYARVLDGIDASKFFLGITNDELISLLCS